MAEKLTREDAIAALERAVALKGADHKYRAMAWEGGACHYAARSKHIPRCIVGFVLKDVAPDVFKRVSEREKDYDSSFAVRTAVLPYDLFDTEAIDVLERAQNSQDNDNTWGEALESAKRLYA